MKELNRAMKDASKKALADMREETSDYYEGSTPRKDGYIRTYFLPSSGKAYFDRQ